MPLFSHRVRSMSRVAWSARLLVLMLITSLAGAVQAEITTVNVDSPGKILQVTLEVDGGTPYYRVQRLGQPVLERSRLGFQLRDGRLDRGLVVLSQARQRHDDTWEQPWGETRLVRNHYNEL
ncbi:MAG: glycoside hydrolase family 97 protein, partial [Oxalobacteraceae bacterium]